MTKFELGAVFIFLLLLSYAGYLSYQSIDFDVLKKLEAQPLVLPPPPTTIPIQK
ncbi:MAG: hypothetical protein WC841_02190 [Candidatus Shapirobacteria bacterium]|jgi:hypothetical protein